jgi:Domain of unknown function (DUF4340)
MIRKTTWILLAVFGVSILGAVLWSGRQASQGEADATPTVVPAWQVDSASIRSIRLEDLATGTVVEVERHPEEAWHLLQPTSGPADVGRVERAATWLASPQPRAVLPASDDLQAFGLDQPAKRISLTLEDGSQKQLDVGRTDPTGSVVYARVPDSSDVLLMSKFGLDEVLTLLETIPTAAPTPTATASATAASVTPSP